MSTDPGHECEQNAAPTRICTTCGLTKPLDEFQPHSRYKYGRRSQCRSCQNRDQRRRKEGRRVAALIAAIATGKLVQLPLFPLTKTCTGCGISQSITNFYQVAGRRGRASWLSQCKGCARRWAAEHPDLVRLRARTYKRTHPEKRRLQKRRDYYAHPERHRAHNARHRRVREATRRAREMAAEGRFTPTDLAGLYAAQGGLCAYCGVQLEGRYHVDHRTPLVRGGSNWPRNLALTCQHCNCTKHTMTAEEFCALRLAGRTPLPPMGT